jgi:hypothetical protein
MGKGGHEIKNIDIGIAVEFLKDYFHKFLVYQESW